MFLLFMAQPGLDVHLHAFGFGAVVPSASLQASDDQLKKTLQQQFSVNVNDSAPGFAVLVKRGGEILFENGYGVRDLRGDKKIDARTNFRLASCSKQFTAMAIMLLVHDAKLG